MTLLPQTSNSIHNRSQKHGAICLDPCDHTHSTYCILHTVRCIDLLNTHLLARKGEDAE